MSNNTITREIPANVTQRILEMKHFVDNARKTQGFDASRLTAQQRELNEFR